MILDGSGCFVPVIIEWYEDDRSIDDNRESGIELYWMDPAEGKLDGIITFNDGSYEREYSG